jgi:hypothetical protein
MRRIAPPCGEPCPGNRASTGSVRSRSSDGDVGAHVAFGRIDDHGAGAARNVIAGEERARALVEEAHVPAGVAGRVERAQAPVPHAGRERDLLAVLERAVEPDETRVVGVRGDRHAVALAHRLDAAGVVGVVVREEHELELAPVGAQRFDQRKQRIELRGLAAAGIDQRHFALADQIGVGVGRGRQRPRLHGWSTIPHLSSMRRTGCADSAGRARDARRATPRPLRARAACERMGAANVASPRRQRSSASSAPSIRPRPARRD